MLGWKLIHQMGIAAQVCVSGQWWLNHLVWTTQLCLPLSKCSGSLYLTRRWRDWPTAGTATGRWAACVSEPRASSLSLLSQSFNLVFFTLYLLSMQEGVGTIWSLRSLPTQTILWFCDSMIEGIFRLVAAFLKMNGIGWSCSLPYLANWSWVTNGLYPVSSACSSFITAESIDNNCWDYHIQEESRHEEQIRKSLWIAADFQTFTRRLGHFEDA